MENELHEYLAALDRVCNSFDIDFLLTGILPTLRKFDLDIENLTPLKRYESLGKAIMKVRGKEFELRLKGYDELNLKFDSVMLEACNTSFQVHLQVSPDEFVSKYNSSLMLAAPVLAAASIVHFYLAKDFGTKQESLFLSNLLILELHLSI